MSQRLAVLNVVGLCERELQGMPFLKSWAGKRDRVSFPPAFPAVTCTAQSSYLTGKPVAEHGIVGNGWYDREAAEVKFWKQSNHLVKGEKLWEALRRERPGFRCAKWFWWYNMYSSAEFSMTPRPMYPADGRKVFDVYAHPLALRDEVKKKLGDFPFPSFWGPRAGIPSSRWIADSAKWIEEREEPELNLVYLPHLDYSLQKYGPGAPETEPEIEAIDEVLADLIPFLEGRGIEVVVLSEYGISAVDQPIHLNRLFREKGWLTIKDELGLEQLDCGASRVFAVADHQVAHIYLNDPALKEEVRELVASTAGVEEVRENWSGVGGERGGDLVAVATEKAWFTYYYWLDDAVAPDFARTIDIHRKPGYDPAELFIDPELKFPQLKVAAFLAKKKLGLRGLLDVIPLDATLVRGSHGRDRVGAAEQPVLIGTGCGDVKQAEDVFSYLQGRCLAAE
ncbi:alkaline phosphatase family protein [Roseibacillus ishigakijimensis]|uniref:Alkaline phosphatase family protein n=1 Tax=Roseibacillus ishigakijimensis TaxID=454146 RepID=A0A934RTH3_9BACT|nr:nucleotide pyrophosphatase/phosphodiesterase family protein [Roseibacillus ishigakijimensis]MBK1833880.1 alkaline phosphatase family protein [Roseibacillus ishigakijimensis]